MLNGSDPSLEARLRGGCIAAFEALCLQNRARVWRIVSSVASGPEAEDLAQETVLRAYRARGAFRGSAPFAAWICRIAVNVAHDYRRSAWRRRVRTVGEVPDQMAPAEDSAERCVERRELQRRVRAAVAELPAPQRIPIWLHYFEGFPVAEVARLERVPEGTMRSRLRAGLRLLEARLGDLLDRAVLGETAKQSPDAPAASETTSLVAQEVLLKESPGIDAARFSARWEGSTP